MLVDPVNQIRGTQTGIFYRNNAQTYCEVAMINKNAGVVAASCIDYVGNSRDPSVQYTVIVSENSRGNSFGVYTVADVIPHPMYNHDTFANNLAVLKLNPPQVDDFTKQIADWPADWSQYYFVHRSLTNIEPFTYNDPPDVKVSEVSTDTDACSRASDIFSQNPTDFICSTLTVTSYVDSACVAPYGSMYGVVDPGSSALAAIFSHSAIYSDDGYCGNAPIYNYYVILRNYIPWIKQASGQDVLVYNKVFAQGYTAASDVNYQMKPATGAVKGVLVLGNYTLTQQLSSAEPLNPVLSDVFAEPALPPLRDTEPEEVTSTKHVTESSTEIISSTEIVSTTTTLSVTSVISETSTIDSTSIQLATSTLEETSTVIETLTSVELKSVTVTTQQIIPTVVGAVNSIETAIIITVNEVSVITVGNGRVETETVTVQATVTEPASTLVQSMGATTVTETVTYTEAPVSITVNETVTLAPSVESLVTTVTFTDYDFYTLTTTRESLVTTTIVSQASSTTLESASSQTSSAYPTDESSEIESSSEAANDSDNNRSGISTWMIVAIVILSLAILVAIVWFCIYRQRKKREEERQEALAYIAQPRIATEHRVDNWYFGKLWDRAVGSKKTPPDYASRLG
ncbi:hypothetical protein IW140_005655 [Coemansia sp. RSA 1813]|nr:hypothetical protein IW140_005655 [Coemansia sp. RSA 1813]